MGKQKKHFPISKPIGQIDKPPRQGWIWGTYANEADHTEDAPGVIFLSEQQRQWLAGALYSISLRYPMDARFIKFNEAQALYDGALQLMALKPLVLNFRRKPPATPADYDVFRLQARILNGEWFDTDYAPKLYLENTYFNPPTDEAGTVIGEFTYNEVPMLPDGKRPFAWDLTLNRALLATLIEDAQGIAVSPGGLAYATLIDHPTATGKSAL